MAAPKAHVDVAERRLRPVYDALDNLNNKQAIKLVDNILKKQKDLLCAKALKSLALIRSGRNNEGVSLLDEIKTSELRLDDSTLQAMTMCYKETNMPHGIVSIYEIAVQQSPKNEEFLSHFFMACVRVEDYIKQQKAAMNLYKAFPKNPYYFWTVMSNFMHAMSTKDMKKKDMLLNLAERMVSKFIKEDKIEAEEEVRLYMLILEHLNKYKELVHLVQSEFGDKLKCVLTEKTEKEIEYLTKLNNWVEVNIKYKSALQKNADQWSFYCGYFNSIKNLKETNYEPDVPVDTENIQPDYTDDKTLETLHNLHAENPIFRGPLLALLEFHKCRSEEASSDLLDLLHQYYKQFGHKLCCFNDIKQYTYKLNEDQRKQFIEYLITTYKVNETDDVDISYKQQVDNLMREICIECLCRQLAYYCNCTPDEKFAKAKTYMRRYNDTLQLAAHLNSTEPQYGDTLVLLAAYLLLDINKEKGDSSMLWHVLLILEESVESSPTNYQFKLLLLFLYARLGAYGACDELMLDAEVKYIMYDSLGYMLSYAGYTSGQFQATLRLHDASIGFYGACAKDTPEQIIAAYKYGSFRQIPEITRFKNRVKTSYQHANILLESSYLDLMRFANCVKESKERLEKGMSVLDSLDMKDISSLELHDNRDFTVMENFEPISEHLTEEQKLQSFQENLLWIRMRYLLLQAVNQCVVAIEPESVSNGDCEEVQKSCEIDESLNKIQLVLTEVKDNTSGGDMWTDIQHPPPSYLIPYIEGEHVKVISTLVGICAMVQKAQEIDEACEKTIQDGFIIIREVTKKNLVNITSNLTTSHGGNTMFNGNYLKHIIFFIETCNLVAILLYATRELIKKKLVELRKNKKKKSPLSGSKHEVIYTLIKEMCNSFSVTMTTLNDQLVEVKQNHVDQTLDVSVLEDLFEKTNSTTVTRIWQKIQASYQQSINEISQVLVLKINFFKLLTS